MIPGIVAGRVLASPPPFPNDSAYASVVALLHFNGADASARIVDQRRPYIWTPNGNVQLDTAQTKFGPSSCLFDGSGDYLSIPADTSFNLSGDFTVECWLRLNSLAAINGIWYLGNVTTNPIARMSFDIKTDGSGSLFAENAAGTQLFGAATAASTFTTGVWFHLACTRSGNALTVWKDGVSVATGTATGTPVTTNVFQIGIARSGGAQRFLNGWMDEFRITNGVARYASTFTPPADAFGETTGSMLDDSWNPYLCGPGLSFTNTDHTIVRPAGGNDGPDNSAVSKRARSYGKHYTECTMNRDGGGWSGYFGFIDAGVDIAAISTENYTTGLQIAPSRGFVNTRIVREGVAGTVAQVYASGMVAGLATDFDAGKAWIRVNDDWVKSDLSTTTTFDASSPTVTWTPGARNFRLFAMSPFGGTECTLNVGATAFARTPPVGFGAW